MDHGQHQALLADDARLLAFARRIFADKVGYSSIGGFYLISLHSLGRS